MAKVPTIIGGLYWNDKSARYIGSNGRFLSPLQVRSIIDEDIEAARLELEATALRLQRGELSVDQWRLETARQIKRLHIANYCAARGGTQGLTKRDFGRMGARIKRQYKYLNRFAVQISRRPELIQQRRFVSRVGSYAQAGRETFEAIRAREEVRRGAVWARRVLHATESCAGCLAVAGRWMLVADMPPIGSLQCNIHCKCTIEYAYTADKPGDGPLPPSKSMAKPGKVKGLPSGKRRPVKVLE